MFVAQVPALLIGFYVMCAALVALWACIRQLASQAGTRAPGRLYLVPDVNAAVWENSGSLGLIPGQRQMMVGVPLLMALTPAQLDAVLAHGLGHYGNRDTRLGGLVGRASQSVLSAVRAAATRKGGSSCPVRGCSSCCSARTRSWSCGSRRRRAGPRSTPPTAWRRRSPGLPTPSPRWSGCAPIRQVDGVDAVRDAPRAPQVLALDAGRGSALSLARPVQHPGPHPVRRTMLIAARVSQLA